MFQRYLKIFQYILVILIFEDTLEYFKGLSNIAVYFRMNQRISGYFNVLHENSRYFNIFQNFGIFHCSSENHIYFKILHMLYNSSRFWNILQRILEYLTRFKILQIIQNIPMSFGLIQGNGRYFEGF